MSFVKRRKQPHLFRDLSVDPTKQVAASLVRVDAHTRKLPKKKAVRGK